MEPLGCTLGVKMMALGASGDPVGVKVGQGRLRGPKSIKFGVSFWSHFETKTCSKTEMENNTKNKCMFATIAGGTEV